MKSLIQSTLLLIVLLATVSCNPTKSPEYYNDTNLEVIDDKKDIINDLYYSVCEAESDFTEDYISPDGTRVGIAGTPTYVVDYVNETYGSTFSYDDRLSTEVSRILFEVYIYDNAYSCDVYEVCEEWHPGCDTAYYNKVLKRYKELAVL